MRIHQKFAAECATLLLVLAAAVGMSACGGGGASTGTVTSVSISPTSGSVSINNQLELTANVIVAGQTNSTTPVTTSTIVTWYVNGVSGGNSTVGTIVTDPNDAQAGVYTAPATVPSTNNGQVSITASAQRNPNGSAGGGSNTPVTSNTATITVSPGLGLLIVSPQSVVSAGGGAQFNATFNGVNDVNAVWSVSSANGGDIGSIASSGGVGLYTAPAFPPPGGVVTITVTDSSSGTTVTQSTPVQIAYSDPTLKGNFAFQYTGNDASGFLAAAGSFVADGKGKITSGVEDVSSFATGVTGQANPIQINGNTSGYIINPDGRGIATLNTSAGTQTIAFVLTTNQHAIITRFDSSATGTGTMDQQNLAAIGGSVSTISGPYAFSAIGTDGSFDPEAVAGRFSANGGTISASGSSVDLHVGATSSATITTASPLASDSSYAFDSFNLGTGRGNLTLNVGTRSLLFSFYAVDSTKIYLVEIDGAQPNPPSYLAGQAYSAVTGAPGLASANYALNAGGSASNSKTIGAFALGGVFASSGSGSVPSGTIDVNNQGAVTANSSLTATCGYTVDGNTGRIDVKLCAGGSGATTYEFAAYPYQTDLGSEDSSGFLLVEIDTNAASIGTAFEQSTASTLTTGGFALGLAGQGISHGSRSTAAQNVDGEFSGTVAPTGKLDVNFFAATAGDPIKSATLGTPSSAGRGTLVIQATSPAVTYQLVYYIVSNNQVLLFDQDTNSSFVLIGTLERQF